MYMQASATVFASASACDYMCYTCLTQHLLGLILYPNMQVALHVFGVACQFDAYFGTLLPGGHICLIFFLLQPVECHVCVWVMCRC